MEKQVTERGHDCTVLPSIEEKFVHKDCENAVSDIGNCFEIELPEKIDNLKLQSDCSNALEHFVKPERSVEFEPELKEVELCYMLE